MIDATQNSYLFLPENLPAPKDDGAANHLPGFKLPDLELTATNGSKVNLSMTRGRNVVFCYPMTGVPGVPLPEGWDDIPGARGCTPQACSYRDKYSLIQPFVNNVFGLSTQDTKYQKELHDRLDLPYEILSDSNLEFKRALNLPTFEVDGKELLKRLTLILKDGLIEKVHYPVFPSNKDVDWVIGELAR
jgi:peroxiredoxin